MIDLWLWNIILTIVFIFQLHDEIGVKMETSETWRKYLTHPKQQEKNRCHLCNIKFLTDGWFANHVLDHAEKVIRHFRKGLDKGPEKKYEEKKYAGLFKMVSSQVRQILYLFQLLTDLLIYTLFGQEAMDTGQFFTRGYCRLVFCPLFWQLGVNEMPIS